MIIVTIKKLRPDVRVFIDLLYTPGRNVDSDGDACDIWDRNGHYLYLRDRTPSSASVDIYAKDTSPHLFEVTSESQKLEDLAGLYLYLYCGERIERNGKPLTYTVVMAMTEKYGEDLERAKRSIWHSSSDEYPYPNQPGKS